MQKRHCKTRVKRAALVAYHFLPLALLVLPGVSWAALRFHEVRETVARKPVEVFVVSDDGSQPRVEWEALTPGQAYFAAGKTVPELVSQAHARVGVNANFYREDARALQEPIGLVMHEGRMLSPPSKGYPTAGVIDGKLEWDNVTFTAIAGVEVNGKVLRARVCRFNLPATAKCAALWSGRIPGNLRDAIYLKISQSGLSPGSHGFKTTTAPEPGDWALQWSSKKALGGAPTQLSLDLRLFGKRFGAKWQGVREAVSGSHVLTPTAGYPRINRSWAKTRQPRTLVGVDTKGRGWVAVFDGRSDKSKGLSVSDAWKVVRSEFHAAWAINLDGGGSTTMLYDGRLVNHPSDGVPRAVAAGWGSR